MRYNWRCSSYGSNFGYRDSRKSARKMDKFVGLQRKRKRSSSRERDFCKRDRNVTSSCSESASQVFSSENDIGNFIGVPVTDADRRKVLFNCWSPPSGFSFHIPYVSIFQDNVEREVSGSASSRQKLKPICATSWVERHDSIIIFMKLLLAVVLHLRNCSRKTSKWRL